MNGSWRAVLMGLWFVSTGAASGRASEYRPGPEAGLFEFREGKTEWCQAAQAYYDHIRTGDGWTATGFQPAVARRTKVVRDAILSLKGSWEDDHAHAFGALQKAAALVSEIKEKLQVTYTTNPMAAHQAEILGCANQKGHSRGALDKYFLGPLQTARTNVGNAVAKCSVPDLNGPNFDSTATAAAACTMTGDALLAAISLADGVRSKLDLYLNYGGLLTAEALLTCSVGKHENVRLWWAGVVSATVGNAGEVKWRLEKAWESATNADIKPLAPDGADRAELRALKGLREGFTFNIAWPHSQPPDSAVKSSEDALELALRDFTPLNGPDTDGKWDQNLPAFFLALVKANDPIETLRAKAKTWRDEVCACPIQRLREEYLFSLKVAQVNVHYGYEVWRLDDCKDHKLYKRLSPLPAAAAATNTYAPGWQPPPIAFTGRLNPDDLE